MEFQQIHFLVQSKRYFKLEVQHIQWRLCNKFSKFRLWMKTFFYNIIISFYFLLYENQELLALLSRIGVGFNRRRLLFANIAASEAAYCFVVLFFSHLSPPPPPSLSSHSPAPPPSTLSPPATPPSLPHSFQNIENKLGKS